MRPSAVSGIILANSRDEALGRMTAVRSMASVPFGGRYRLVDFCLSNLVNAGITNVGIITKANYRSLMDHIESGAFWDLDRKRGGVHLLPPFNISGARRYHGYVEALYGAMDFLNRCNSDYIVLCEGSIAANVDISAAVDFHINKNADITVVYRRDAEIENVKNMMRIKLDSSDRLVFADFPESVEKGDLCSLGILIFGRELLIELINNAYENGGRNIDSDIIADRINDLNICGFEHTGFSAVMTDIKAYTDANMSLLKSEVRKDLFNPERKIMTKNRDDMPTRYGTKSIVENSFVADGCVIDGTVKNSIVFRGVAVKKGAYIENSIIMQDCVIGENAIVQSAICDKKVTVSSNTVVKGTEGKPVYIEKNQKF
ncbi:MAG: glucose-1-phosphate adenylyltransferase subunit GlgD [Clostridia bacterium]|nr:glucose-1-phosphate adenylyltransferase subunit GlgD [Clostridia bacterium]